MPTFEVTHEQGRELYESIAEKVEDTILDMGLPPATRPKDGRGRWADRPMLPHRLSDCSWGELQDLLGQLTAWFTYAVELLPTAIANRNGAEQLKALTWSQVRRTKTGTVSDKDDAVRADVRYINVCVEYETRHGVVQKLNNIIKGLEQELSTVSRVGTMEDSRQNAEGRSVGAERKAGRRKVERDGDVLNVFNKKRRVRGRNR